MTTLSQSSDKKKLQSHLYYIKKEIYEKMYDNQFYLCG